MNNTMWAVHVQGPDDLYAVPTREIGDATALLLNHQFERNAKSGDPLLRAVVTEWPYGYETWKAEAEQFPHPSAPIPAAYGGAGRTENPACNKAPLGWRCTRAAGHEGPCAAYAAHPAAVKR